MKFIDSLLDRTTMYRLLLYYLILILCAAMYFGAIGVISYSPYSIFLSAIAAVTVCWITNYIFARLYNAPSNPDSSILTGLILALVITPPSSIEVAPFLVVAAGLAIAAKYILAINNKHVFNPVAIAVVLTAYGPLQSASWWVGTASLAPFVIFGGLILVRKIRRTKMVMLFFAVALGATSVVAVISQQAILATLQSTILHSSLLFLGFVMLTEPMTSPTSWSNRRWYAIIVGICFVPEFHIGGIYSTPELALVIGNFASFLMTPKVKTLLYLKAKSAHGSTTEDFIFEPERKFNFTPGQYIELTLPHSHADQRGSRRTFTIASSPTEQDLRIGIRFYDNGSSFKETLRTAGSELFLSAGQLGGDFVLPRDTTQKLAFIAGGIGVTPFRSMIKYLSDTNQKRDITVFYAEKTIDKIAYTDIFEEARNKIGTKVLYIISDVTSPTDLRVKPGNITTDLIRSELADYQERIFYISGPQSMVQSVKHKLLKMGVKRKNIKVDYFSGYA